MSSTFLSVHDQHQFHALTFLEFLQVNVVAQFSHLTDIPEIELGNVS